MTYGKGPFGKAFDIAAQVVNGKCPICTEDSIFISIHKTVDKLSKHIESMALTKVNIEFLTKQMDKVLTDIESLKDKARDMHYKNGNGSHQ